MSPSERSERAEQKRGMVLGFLASERWTTPATIADLLQTQRQNADRLIHQLEKERLLIVDKQREDLYKNRVVVGITREGIMESGLDLDQCVAPYGRGRAPLSQFRHQVACHKYRVLAERAGWTDFMPDKIMRTRSTPVLKRTGHALTGKLPDYLAKNQMGQVFAFEVETSIKSPDRYKTIFGLHIEAIERFKRYEKVVYISDTDRRLKSLKRVVERIDKILLWKGWHDVDPYLRLFDFVLESEARSYFASFDEGVNINDV